MHASESIRFHVGTCSSRNFRVRGNGLVWSTVFAIAFFAFHKPAQAQVQCFADDECDDGINCTVDACKFPDNICQHTRVDALCAPGGGCTQLIGCDPSNVNSDAQGCVYSRNDAFCNDGFSCTDDGCDPSNPSADATGCVYSRNDANCDDGFSCTDNFCNPVNAPAGSTTGCQFPKVDSRCDDGNACTEDGCDPTNGSADANGCVFNDTNAAPGCCNSDDDCNDGFSCTVDVCSLGTHTCQFSRVDANCNDNFSCTDNFCNPTSASADPTTGCQFPKVDSRCDDGFSCTDNFCNPASAPAGSTTGCQFPKVDSRCTDTFSCTDTACNPANAPAGSSTGCQVTRFDSRCDDGNACTSDGCDPTNGNADANGCVFNASAVPGCCDSDDDCNDGFSCTVDVCSLGTHTCQFSRVDANCNDTFSCTDNFCNPTSASADPTTGCQFPKVDSRCDDGFSCTDDFCNPASAPAGSTTGCQFQKVDSRCTDTFSCTDTACNPTNAPAGSTTGCQITKFDERCDDGNNCTVDGCDPTNGNADANGCVFELGDCGACCFSSGGECREISSSDCENDGGTFLGPGTTCTLGICTVAPRDQRLSTVKKGSLLIFPAAELGWSSGTSCRGWPNPDLRDTVITLVNDFSKDVKVKLYYVNGDAPTDPIYADELHTVLVERAHNGWNQVDFTVDLSENESTYLVLSTGVGGGQRFTILDPGSPPGRPNLEPDGGRVLRGFVIAFAVDENQEEISWNHLSGHADIIDYGLRSAWEYQAYAFQATNPTVGAPTDGHPGQLNLDGVEYDYAFNTLLFDFFAAGSMAYTNGNIAVMLDTDLTLMPVSTDLRQDSCGPVTTKAHFDIWNANEDFRSGTARCITCWDQTLLSAYSLGNGLDNNFLISDLGTNKGKARIDGMASFECDNRFVPGNLEDAILQWLLLHDHPTCNDGGKGNNDHCCNYTINDSQYAALLGVAAKVLHFSIGATGTTHAGMNLVGAGQESAQILFDVPAGPETSSSGGDRSNGGKVNTRGTLGHPNGK